MSAQAELHHPARTETEAMIAQRFAREEVPGLPIYLLLQNALIRLVRDRALAPDAQLPSDSRLAAVLAVSLGTVQKALGNLANQGWVRREHGRGTFVAVLRRSVPGSWHFRFRDPETNERLPVYSRLLRRRKSATSRILPPKIGPDPQGYVEISRLFDVGTKFVCFGQLWLGASRFARLLDYPSTRIENVNLKDVFAEEFDAPTIAVHESIRAISFNPEIAKHLRQSARASGMCLEVLAVTRGAVPFSFQQIYIPATDCALDITPLRPADAAGLDLHPGGNPL